MNKKSKKIITIILIVLVIITLIYVGITASIKISDTNRRKDFEESATKYYNTYMKGLFGTNESVITLRALKNISEREKYNLNSLEKCSDDSKITFTIDNGKITDKKIDLKCN